MVRADTRCPETPVATEAVQCQRAAFDARVPPVPAVARPPDRPLTPARAREPGRPRVDLVRGRHGGTVQGQGAGLGGELPRLRRGGLLSRHHLPPRRQRLRRSGRRLHRQHDGEGHPTADPERSHQRPAQPARHGRDGPHPEPAQRDLAVLLQRREQLGPGPHRLRAAGFRLCGVRTRPCRDGRRGSHQPHADAQRRRDGRPAGGAGGDHRRETRSLTAGALVTRPLLVIFLTIFVNLVGFGIIIPLLPFYAQMFGASPLVIGLLFASFSLSQLVAAPVLGDLSDRIGRRPILLFSLLGTVVSFAMLALAHGLAMLFAALIVDGLSGGNITTARAYIADVSTEENRAKSFGLLGAACGLGFIIGPALSAAFSRISYTAPIWAA